MPRLAKRFLKVGSSASMAVAAEARRLRALGKPIIDLSLGELDFPTPTHVCNAAVRAIEAGATKYDHAAGIRPLREAIAAKLERDKGLKYSPDRISVGCGAKQIISSALCATLDPGDEVVVPVPYWTSYPEIVRLYGGVAVLARCAAGNAFKLRGAELAAILTPMTKWVMLNSPNNPTGAVYGRDELRELADVLLDAPHVGVISDDIYDNMVFGPEPARNLVEVEPRLRDRTLIVNGVSKTYAMTGWRVGYGAGSAEIIGAINAVQSQTTTHTSTISQHAAVEALNGPQTASEEFARTMRSRAAATTSLVNGTEGLSCIPPAGAFYCFANCAELIGRRAAGGALDSDTAVAAYLLQSAQVAVVPGSAYGCSPYLRISFAADEGTVQSAFGRIAASIQALR